MIEDAGGKPSATFPPICRITRFWWRSPTHPKLQGRLAVTGKGRIARRLPMVAGIDRGHSRRPLAALKIGDKVIETVGACRDGIGDTAAISDFDPNG